MPIALDAADGRRDYLEIFGDDYPTPDGTCIRVYIHVSDLAEAHALAIAALKIHREMVLNLGSGVGYSNRQVVETIKKVTQRDFEIRYTERRPGDTNYWAGNLSNRKLTLLSPTFGRPISSWADPMIAF
jgi:UDP-glucose 4-epimerase